MFTVTTDADSGPGSLRDAITQANGAGGADTIEFAISSGQQTITPVTPLPAVSGTTTIDGQTQPGYAGQPLIVISGASQNSFGLQINGADSVVRGLVVNGCASQAGIRLTSNADGSTVTNCYLGTDATGTTAVPNSVGLRIDPGCANAVIGGTAPGDRNLIAGNTLHGVALIGGTDAGNSIRGNSIRDNGGLGINLSGGIEDAQLVTANDPGDGDTGPNNLQNFPLLGDPRVNNLGTQGRVTGTLFSTPNTAYVIDVYANVALDGFGNAEGETYLGSVNASTDAQGNASFTFQYTPVAGTFLTATATGPAGSTSEFSAPVVQGPNANPVANNDFYVADEDAPLTVPAFSGVLANDSDPDGDPLTLTLLAPPTGGNVQVNPDGSFTYTPDPDFNGFDSFTYEVSDGLSTTAATAAIDVNAMPDFGKIAFSDSEFFATEDSGSGLVTVVRTGGTDGFVTVGYTITPGTATANADYAAFNGTLTFFGGIVSRDINISVFADQLDEASETLTITLGTPTGGATFEPGAPPSATLTIVNSDALPAITIADPAATLEGNPDDPNVVSFVVSMSRPSTDPVTVAYGFDGVTAVEGEDFDPSAADPFGTLTFAPGETTKTIEVPLVADTVNEQVEIFTASLFLPTSAVVTDSFAVVEILNDDNHVPTAAGQTLTRAPGAGSLTIELAPLTADADVDAGDVLNYMVDSVPMAGTASLDNNGTPLDSSDDFITYTPSGLGLADDSFTYRVSDAFGGTSTARIRIETRGVAELPDPLDPTKTNVVVAATSAPDSVQLVRTRTRGELRIMVNGVDQGTVAPTGRVLIAGGDGDDTVDARGLTVGVTLAGGEGDDTIFAGKGADLILGGDGDDVIRGGERRDILIGGRGRDTLIGGANDDLLIAGTIAAMDDSPESVAFRADLVAAWGAPGSREARIAALAEGSGTTGVFLDDTNVFDDDAQDYLVGNGGADWFFGVSDRESDTRDRFNGKIDEDEFTELDIVDV